VSDASSGLRERVDLPSVVAGRLDAFASRVLAGAMNRPVQRRNGGVYLRGLIEQGPRKSLEPMVERLGGDADYQSLSSSWRIVRGIRWRSSGRSLSGLCRRPMSRRGCWVTPGLRW
jgi:hypothetical protein